MRTLSLMLPAVVVLAACSTPRPAPQRLEDVAFSIPAAVGNDTIVFNRDGSFVRRTSGNRGERERIITGSWRLVQPEYQVVLLDGQNPGRLTYSPEATPAWRFVPVATVPFNATLGSNVEFVHLAGQFYATKASLAPAAGEASIAPLLAGISSYAPAR